MKKELVILTGVSGAGKSTAMGYLEDLGYYCVDNMPVQLISSFLNLLASNEEYSSSAMVCDVRSVKDFEAFIRAVNAAVESFFSVKIIYLDIKLEETLKRYKLTRRKHPLADSFDGDIEMAVRDERSKLAKLRERSNFVIDTTDLKPAQLKERLCAILFGEHKSSIQIHCTSFGFTYGIAPEADFVLDVRCLPNPYWVEKMKYTTGDKKEVVDYIFSFEEAVILRDKLFDIVDFLLPLYVREGKSQLVLAIGCTGGKQRSVAFVNALGRHLEKEWDNVAIHHRDILK